MRDEHPEPCPPAPAIVRLLVARGKDDHTHTYGLTAVGTIVADNLRVKAIEPAPYHPSSLLLVTERQSIEVANDHLCQIISGRLWTEPAQGEREIRRFRKRYPREPQR